MKTILITGASSGIGRACAELFADRDFNVVATMRDPAAGVELARRENVVVTRLDVEKPETVGAAIELGVERFGGIDILLNNAGVAATGVFEEIPATVAEELFRVNVFGVMEVTRAILPHFRARGGGTIVNVSSAVGMVGVPLNSLYTATKFALEGFSETIAFELLARNIVVKLVEPGLVRTNLSANWLDDLVATDAIADYREYKTFIQGAFAPMMEADVPEPAEVAQEIFDAATDGTERLRYLVTDGAREMVAPRRSLPEEEYVETMRAAFRPPQALA